MSSSTDASLRRLSALAVGSVLLLIVLSGICNTVLQRLPGGASDVLSVLSPLLTIGLPFVLYKRLTECEPFSAAAERNEKPPRLPLAGLFCAAAAGGMLCARASACIFPLDGVDAIPTGAALVCYALRTCAVTPVLEEWAFRGALLSSLRRYGDGFAVAASAVLFALAHTSPLRWPAALLCGGALGLCAVTTGSLRMPIVLHIAYNCVQLILLMEEYTPALPILAAIFAVGAISGFPALRLPHDEKETAGALREYFTAPAMWLLWLLAACLLLKGVLA